MRRLSHSTLALVMIALGGVSACGDPVGAPAAPRDDKVVSVTVAPSNIVIFLGDKLTLSATVIARPDQADRRVRWASQNPAVASVDDAGIVSALARGTTRITATSIADTTVVGTAVVSVVGPVGPSVTISEISHNGAAVDLTNAFGTLDVALNVDGASPVVSRVDVIMTSAGADTAVATFQPSSAAAPGPVTLTFNSVGLRNGQWTLKVRVILTSGTITVSSSVMITINNQ
jgi:hypothetical protein